MEARETAQLIREPLRDAPPSTDLLQPPKQRLVQLPGQVGRGEHKDQRVATGQAVHLSEGRTGPEGSVNRGPEPDSKGRFSPAFVPLYATGSLLPLSVYDTHLHQDLRLHPPRGLVLPVAPPRAHQRVDLVQEDGAGGVVAGQLEQDLRGRWEGPFLLSSFAA